MHAQVGIVCWADAGTLLSRLALAMALSMRFISSRLSFRWIVFLVDNRFYLLVQIGLPYNSGIEVVGPVGPFLRSDKAALNELIDDLFQWLTVSFVHGQQEKGQHGQNHEQRCRTGTHMGFGKKKQRDSQKSTAAKRDELTLGEVEHHLGLDLGQILGYRDIGHRVSSFRLMGIEDGFGKAFKQLNSDQVARWQNNIY
jgi:hypothetical protein